MYQKIFVGLFIVIFSLSCNNKGIENNVNKDSISGVQKEKTNNSQPDITGNYALSEAGCKLTLTIVKEKEVFKYNFKGEHLDIEGIAIVSGVNDEIYVTFDGPIGNVPPKTVEGLFKDNGITIQNTGNSQNNYTYFEDCDQKYLEFKKK